MTVSRPEFLWLLALAAPLTLAHLYRVRRRRMVVPYLRFWEEVQAQEKWRSLWTRLKDAGLLFLNLGMLSLLTGAAAGVDFPGLGPPARSFIFLWDDTPSMLSDSRAADARQGARRFEEEILTYRDTVRHLTFQGRPVPEEGAIPIDFAPRGDLSEVCRRLAAESPGAEIVLVSDGSQKLPDLPRIVVGKKLPNVSVAGLSIKGGRSSVRVRNHSSAPMAGRLTIAGRTIEISLQGGEERTVEDAAPAGPLKALWQPADGLSVDQASYSVGDSREPPPVMLFARGEPSPFLVRALEALAEHGLVSRDRRFSQSPEKFEEIRDAVIDDYWLLFEDCAPPADLKRGRILLLGNPGPVASSRIVERTRILKMWDALEGQHVAVSVRRSTLFERAGGVAPILESEEGPIAVALRRGGLSVAVVGFRLEDSDLPLSPAFPLLLKSIVRWTFETRLFPSSVGVGERVRNRYPIDSNEVTVRSMNGAPRAARVEVRGGIAEFTPEAPGFHVVAGPSFSETIAVNFDDERESDLSIKERTEVSRFEPPGWWWKIRWSVWAAATGLVLCLLEWGLARRGAAA
jgi:hypothetical protein